MTRAVLRGPFWLEFPTGIRWRLDAWGDEPAAFMPMLLSVGRENEEARASDGGRLELRFERDARLRARAGDTRGWEVTWHLEPRRTPRWTFRGEGGRLIARGGGGHPAA